MSATTSRRFVWHGIVQGVGFRASVRRAATRGSVDGWVRNRTDGSVEALLVGSLTAIESVANALSREWGSSITSVDWKDEPPTAVTGFQIVATAPPSASSTPP